MGRENQKKGDIAKSKAIYYFTQCGYDVGILITESAPYDLLVDIGKTIKRVQVKYVTNSQVDLRRIHSNASGYVVNYYGDNDFDWMYIYSPKYGEYLIKDVNFKDRRAINLKKKYKVGNASIGVETSLEN